MTELSFSLLGPQAALCNGQSLLPFPTLKVQALLSILLAERVFSPCAPIRREILTTRLWPGMPEESARKNLRQTLYLLRQAIPTAPGPNGEVPFVVGDYQRLEIHPQAHYDLDLASFVKLSASGEPQALAEGIKRYQGDFLEDFYLDDSNEFEEWAAGRRAALHLQALNALLILANHHLAQGEFELAETYARRLVQHEPLNEEGHVLLMRLYALSHQRLQAIRQYQNLKEILHRELNAEPEAASREFYQSILSGEYPPAEKQIPSSSPVPVSPGHNLPTRLSSFVGRGQEIEMVQKLLTSCRLVSLTGAGGVGKSSLAVQTANQVADRYPDGTWLLELAVLSDPQRLAQSVAAVFRLHPDERGDFLPTLQAYLENKRLLLILDNCEHIIEACTRLVESLLKACPQVTILVTSREQLQITGEHVYAVPSLPFPDGEEKVSLDDYASYSAVQLFLERASAILPGFELSQANAAQIGQICRRLDGIPLAIELAAARVSLLNTEQIAKRLEDCFQLLNKGGRTALPHHQTLRASIDWSYHLLSAAEQTLLRRLSVFVGGWTMEAAEAICCDTDTNQNNPIHHPQLPADDPTTQPCIFDLHDSLVQKSLVVAERREGIETRYRLLETVRQYAHEKLIDREGCQELRQRHLEYYLQLGEAGKQTPPDDWLECLLRLKPESDNLRAGLGWALDQTPERNADLGLRLANAFLSAGKRFDPDTPHPSIKSEFLDWARKGIKRLDDYNIRNSLARAEALIWMGSILYNADGFQLAREGVSLYRENPQTDPRDLAWALGLLSQMASIVIGDRSLGRKLSKEGVTILSGMEAVCPWDFAFALILNCISAWIDEDYDVASKDALRSYEYFVQEGDLYFSAEALRLLAVINEDQGEYATARSQYETVSQLLHQIPPEYAEFSACGIQMHLKWSADFEYQQGNYQAALEKNFALMTTAQERGDKTDIAYLSVKLARVYIALGRREQAMSYLRNAMDVSKANNYYAHFLFSLGHFAEVYTDCGQMSTAAVLLGAAETRSTGFHPSYRRSLKQCSEKAKAALGEEAFSAAFAEGKAMTLEQAGEFSRQMLDTLDLIE